MVFFITKDEQQHRIRLYLYPIFESGTDEPAGEYYLLPQMSVSLDNPSEIAPVIVDEEYLQAVIHTPISLCMTFMKFDSSDGYSTGLNTVVYELEGLTLYCTDDSQEQYVKLLNIDRIACLKGAKIGDKLPDIIRKMGYGAYEETIFSSSTTGATGAAYELSYDINGLTYTFVTNSNETLVSDCVFVKQTIVL